MEVYERTGPCLSKPNHIRTRLVIPAPPLKVILADFGARLEGVPHAPAGIHHQPDVVNLVSVVLAIARVAAEEDGIACFSLRKGNFPVFPHMLITTCTVLHGMTQIGKVEGNNLLVFSLGFTCAVHVPSDAQILLEQIPPRDLAHGPADQTGAVETLGTTGWSGARTAAPVI